MGGSRSRAVGCLVVALASASLPRAASGQEGLTPGDMAITVVVSPGKAMAGNAVTIHGTTGVVSANSQVSVRIQPPGGKAPVVLTAPVAKDGSYDVAFPGGTDLGQYAVQATAPDKKGHAATSFRIVGAGVVPAEVAARADSLVLAAARVIDVARRGARGPAGLPRPGRGFEEARSRRG